MVFFFFTLQYCIGFAIHQHALPRVYTCSASWTPLPPPSPYHLSGSSQCTSPRLPVSCIKPGLVIHFLYDIIHVLMPFSQIIPQLPLPQSPKDCSTFNSEDFPFLYFLVSLYRLLFFTWRRTISISCNASIVMMYSFSFCLNGRLFLLQLWMINLVDKTS